MAMVHVRNCAAARKDEIYAAAPRDFVRATLHESLLGGPVKRRNPEPLRGDGGSVEAEARRARVVVQTLVLKDHRAHALAATVVVRM